MKTVSNIESLFSANVNAVLILHAAAEFKFTIHRISNIWFCGKNPGYAAESTFLTTLSQWLRNR